VIALPVKQGPGVEAEFAVLLGAELPARPEAYDRDSVAAAVAAVCPAIEIAGSRLVDGMAKPDPMMIVADGGSNIGFVQGEPHAGWAGLDLAAQEVTLFINGEQSASGNGGLVMGHPLDAVAWLANELSRDGRGLNVGDVITTGSCTGLTPVRPGDTAVADFGELGTVQARFSD
jgi:2-keto-4-pentenoate hydratase